MTAKERDEVLDTITKYFLISNIGLRTSKEIYQAVEQVCTKHLETKDES